MLFPIEFFVWAFCSLEMFGFYADAKIHDKKTSDKISTMQIMTEHFNGFNQFSLLVFLIARCVI